MPVDTLVALSVAVMTAAVEVSKQNRPMNVHGEYERSFRLIRRDATGEGVDIAANAANSRGRDFVRRCTPIRGSAADVAVDLSTSWTLLVTPSLLGLLLRLVTLQFPQRARCRC